MLVYCLLFPILYDLVHLEYGILSSFLYPLCPIYLVPRDHLLLSSLHLLCSQTDRYIDKSLTLQQLSNVVYQTVEILACFLGVAC